MNEKKVSGLNALTPRDFFAALATEKDIEAHSQVLGPNNTRWTVSREEAKYKYADAMIKRSAE